MRKTRVRFAPSPTGALHIGGVRTALYNYLFARQRGGEFLLRIEDTDSQRFVPGAEEYIIESLKWCGIEIDEGVSVGGPHAPYRQSERKELYLKYATELVEKGWAYYAFDTSAELQAIRAEYEAAGKTFSYNQEVRTTLPTSLSLSAEETQERLANSTHWVVRFKMPENEVVEMKDMVRGEVSVNTATLDDKVLYKRIDELPTYHLANIVDDHLMEISHVIRGEEWLPSLPLHYLLYRAFGWTETQPEFAHLPLLLKPDGKGKLSKRDGDKLGFPVFPLVWNGQNGDTARGYREDGYFADSFINILALMGWNPGTEQEILSMDDLIKLFSIEHVGKSGARFNPEKAKWFNAQYLRMKDDSELASLYSPILESKGVTGVESAKLEKICSLIKERATFVSDFWDLSSFFFVRPESYDAKTTAKFWKNENPSRVQHIGSILEGLENFSAHSTEEAVHTWIKSNELPMGQVMNSFRLAIVGEGKGPSMFDIIEIIGKEETLLRINNALTNIK
ncbi:MAG: glutamate--tRNA ligase [Rikenellaceae bacterium]